MRVVRTYDKDVVNYVLKHPEIEPYINDDYSVGVEYPINEKIYYLVAYDVEIIGLFVCIFTNGITMDAHSAVLPKFRGKQAVEAGKAAIKWVFSNTRCQKIVGVTPENNRAALIFSRLIGFEKEGVNKGSFMKDGFLHNQVYFGLERSKWL